MLQHSVALERKIGLGTRLKYYRHWADVFTCTYSSTHCTCSPDCSCWICRAWRELSCISSSLRSSSLTILCGCVWVCVVWGIGITRECVQNIIILECVCGCVCGGGGYEPDTDIALSKCCLAQVSVELGRQCRRGSVLKWLTCLVASSCLLAMHCWCCSNLHKQKQYHNTLPYSYKCTCTLHTISTKSITLSAAQYNLTFDLSWLLSQHLVCRAKPGLGRLQLLSQCC